MATEGGPARIGIHRKERENRKRKTLLTHTGLLMEGVGSVRLVTGTRAGRHRSACFRVLSLSASHGSNSSRTRRVLPKVEDEEGNVVLLRAGGVVAGKTSDVLEKGVCEKSRRNIALRFQKLFAA
jgi:hypothetical protein